MYGKSLPILTEMLQASSGPGVEHAGQEYLRTKPVKQN